MNEDFIKRLHSIIEVRGSGRRTEESEYRGAMRPGVLFAVYDSVTGQPDYIPPEARVNTDSPRVKKLEPREWIVVKLLLSKNGSISPKEIADEFNVVTRTITEWAKEWIRKGIIEPASGTERIRSYRIGKEYSNLTLSDLGYVEVDD
ncbi:hypothetical protein AKL48_24605 [Salmonella enterica]|nr:hypothetical protein [Salmonella enterica]